MNKILFVGDKQNRVQYARYVIFRHMVENMDFCTIKELSKKYNRYDTIYMASFTLLKKNQIKHPRIIGSATSWKCTKDRNSIKLLKHFFKISANNLSLTNALKKFRPDIIYLPNGVDTNLFYPPDEHIFNTQYIKIGWVGNTDRQEKGYADILKPALHKISKNILMKLIATKKSQSKNILSPEAMANFYRELDFYLVVSHYEGTPNTALEAASCGVPVITTRVGNMTELIIEGKNGFFVESNIDNVVSRINSLNCISNELYCNLRNNIRESICRGWSWNSRKIDILNLFDVR